MIGVSKAFVYRETGEPLRLRIKESFLSNAHNDTDGAPMCIKCKGRILKGQRIAWFAFDKYGATVCHLKCP